MKKIYIFKHDLPSHPHSFCSGTFALNSHTYNPLFEKIVDPPLDFPAILSTDEKEKNSSAQDKLYLNRTLLRTMQMWV